ncbi:hypothetical protein BDW69DRAFT_186425 [Aspergillus filifer]
MSSKVDSLTEAVSRLDLTYESSSPSSCSPSPTSSPDLAAEQNGIEAAFNNIISHVRTFRNIAEDEIDVTQELAHPFTPGGIVFFLLEPLDTHPWNLGTEAVISDCPTLDSLAEGVHLTSGGELNLIDDVTVLDLRAFVSKSVRRRLSDEELKELYELVFEFLYTKRPDVILGMGNDVQVELLNRSLNFPPSTEIVYTKHPSHVVNYNPEDKSKRRDLLAKINEAVRHHTRDPKSGSHDPILDPGALRILLAPETKRLQHYPPPIGKMIKLLRKLSEIWFPVANYRPTLNLTPGEGYFLLRDDQILQLKARATTTYSSNNERELLEAGMAILFMALYKNIKLASWYLDSYKVNWRGIALGVNSAMTRFEWAYGFRPDFKQDYIALLKPGKRTLPEIVADGVMDIGIIGKLMALPMGGSQLMLR